MSLPRVFPCAVVFLTCLAGLGRAGTGTPAAQTGPPVSEEEEGLFGGIVLALSTGYDSHYIYRGEPLGENTGWAEVSLDLALTEHLSLNVTPWFLQDLDTDYSEINLTAALTLSLDPWEFSGSYQGYYYPRHSLGGGEGIRDEHEMSLSVARSFGSLTTSVLSAYSVTREAFYFEAGIEYEIEVTDKLSLTPAVVLGWDSDYFDEGTEFNHVGLMLMASYNLTPWCVLSPYIAGNLPVGHLSYVSNDVYGGVKVTIVF
jgi:hypothetical protein